MYSFRWGIELYDNAYTNIPNDFLRYYAEAGLTNTEMMFIVHLASFKFECRNGQASPALTSTIRNRMGYATNQGVINIEKGLVGKKFLVVEKRPGRTSIYNFEKLSRKILALKEAKSSIKLDDQSSTKLDDPSSIKLDDMKNKNIKQESKNKGERPLAVDVYRTVARRYPDKATWPMISNAVGETKEDLEFWERVVEAYISCGWNKTNIANMLTYFKSKRLPDPTNGHGNGQTGHNVGNEVFDPSTGQTYRV